MLAVDGFVKTLWPWARSIWTIRSVVEDLPALPEISTTPPLSRSREFLSKFGAMKLAIRPGRADPPPRLIWRSRNRSDFPSETARKERI